MAKTKISEYDATAANNTDIDSINIAEGMAPSNVNNAIRELMAHLKDGLGAGTPVFLDQTNNRLSVGTTSPNGTLHVKNATDIDMASSVVGQVIIEGNGYTGGIALNATGMQIYHNSGARSLIFGTNETERARISSSGSVGIGDTAPDNVLNVKESALSGRGASNGNTSMTLEHATDTGIQFFSATQTQLRFGDAASTGAGSIIYTHSDNAMKFSTAESERMRIDSSGNIGIATNSPTSLGTGITTLDLKGNSSSQTDRSGGIRFTRHDGTHGMSIYNADGASYIESQSTYPLLISTNGSERMRIDSSGNIFAGGKTGLSDSVAGHAFAGGSNAGLVYHTRDNSLVMSLHRMSSDGDILRFVGQGSTVGSIFSSGGIQMGIGTGDTAILFAANADAWLPWNTDNTQRDNAIDLGRSATRFDDIFATNSSIQTSDENEKQNIASLTSAEIAAATAISKLFKTYKWKDKVAAKGNDARTHTGVVAQQVQTAMNDAGLDASKYAFWCSDTWWEKDVEVAAVEAIEAKDAVYDDDGNLVSEAVEAVEAKDAYTRTDTFDTKDEAPEGAIERTRLGVRYPELLAFIGAATEQRLTSIEARLDALEG